MTVDLLEDLRQDGRVDSTGRFTLDAAKAREKMKQYQLTDPHLYVLQVLQGAIASGATFAHVKTDADDCWVRHDGRPLSAEQLGALFHSLFASDRDVDARPLRELAIGLNALTGLNPSSVRLECWDGAAGAALTLRDGTESVQPLAACPWPEGGAGVHLHVRQRHSWRTLARFFTGQPEAAAVRNSCRWSPVPITVNGERVNAEPDLGPHVLVRDLEGPGFRARLVVPQAPADSSTVDVVLNGVRMPRKELKPVPLEVRAVVWATGLTKNASQSDVVDDAAWKGLATSLRAHVRDLVIAMAAEPRDEYLPHLVRTLSGADMKAGTKWNLWKGVKKALLDVPLLPGLGGQRLALRPLLEQYDRLGHLPVTETETFPELPDEPLVVVLTGDLHEMVKSVFPTRKNCTRQLEEAQRRELRAAQWRSLPPREPAFEIGRYLARAPLPGPLKGEVALPAEIPRPDPPLMLFKESRPLVTVPFRPATTEERAALWPGVAAAVNHDGVLPDRAWEGVEETPALEEVRVAVEQALPALFAHLAAGFPAQGEARRQATVACLGWLEYLASGGETYSSPERLPPPLADLPLFTRLGGGSATLSELAREIEEKGDVAFLEPLATTPGSPPARLVLQPVGRERGALERYFGTMRLRNYGFDLQHEDRRARFLARPPQEVRILEPTVARVPLSGKDVEGEVALLEGPGLASGVWVMFLHEGRPLGGHQMDTLPGPYVAVAQSPRLTPSPDFQTVLLDPERDRVLAAVHEAARRLPLAIAEKLPGLDEARRDELLGLLWKQLDWESGASCDGFMGKLDATRKALKGLRLFQSLDGAWLSLQDLLDYNHERGKVGYLAGEPPCPPGPGELLVRTRFDRVPLLRGILGTYRVFDAMPVLEERARRQALEAQPLVERIAVPEGPWIAVGPLSAPSVRGEVALQPEPGAPSRLLLHRRGRFLGERSAQLELGVVAAVDSDLLQPDLPQDEGFQTVLGAVLGGARALAGETLRARGPELKQWTLQLAGRLEKESDLVRAVKEVPVFVDADGQPLRLADLGTDEVPYLPAGHACDAAIARSLAGRPVPVLTPLEAELLSRIVYPLRDLAPAVATEETARRNRARERLAHFRLPEGSWLARTEAGEGLQGELGLPAEPGRGVLVCVDGLAMATVDPHPGPGFAGVVNGPFAVTPTWDGLADVAAIRSQLAAAARRVMGELARGFPSLDHPTFPRARQAVLAWTDWRRALEMPLDGVEAALAELPLFPLAGGRHADLATLGEAVRRSGRLLRCRPGEDPPATGEAVWMIAAGSPEEHFLSRFAPQGLLDWKAVVTTVSREEELPIQAAELPAPSPEEELLAALRGELRILRESGHPELSERVLEELVLGRTPNGTLWSCDEGGRRPTLNREHPVVRDLLAGGPIPPERLYFLLSSLYSVLNRACVEIRDEHERGFHRRVLETLLGPGTVPPDEQKGGGLGGHRPSVS